MKTRTSPLWHSRLEAGALRDLQAAKFRRYLATRVLPFSAFYRRRFTEAGLTAADIRSLDDLAKVPFTSKTDLLNTPDEPQRIRDFVLIPDERVLRRQPGTVFGAICHGPAGMKARLEHEFRPLLMTSTTGRSSGPVPFVFTGHDLDILTESGRRIMEVGGTAVTSRHVNLFPFAPHLAFWQTHYAGIGHGTFCLSTGGGKVMGTEGNVALIERIAPEVIIGMPTFLYHVLTHAVAEDRHWPQLRTIVLGGEKVPPGLRRKFRALCAELGAGRVEVLATYGFTEAKMAWMECPPPPGEETSGYHLNPDFNIVEIIDPDTGRTVGEGEPGEIVYTALDSRGTVVLRYRTGDRIDGGLTYAACPHCGRTCPRLTGNISRVSEMRAVRTDKIKGTLVDFNELEHALDDLEGIGAWQIELCKVNDDPFERDAVVIHAVALHGNLAELEREMSARFHRAAEIRPNRIEWHCTEEMRERQGVGRLLKEEKIMDRRPKADGSVIPVKPRKTEPVPARVS